jgi:hypothetical protein
MSNLNNANKKSHKKRLLLIVTCIFLVAIFSTKFFIEYAQKNKALVEITPVEFDNLKVLGQESTIIETNAKNEKALASSESFSAMQISANGGGVGNSEELVDFEDSGLLRVEDIKSELYTIKDGDKSEVKAIISCQTNRKATLEIEYFKSGEKNKHVMKDVFFSSNHITILSSLDTDSVYRYAVSALDSRGNKVTSDQFVFYTGAPSVSLMDTLSGATQKVFGWAMK